MSIEKFFDRQEIFITGGSGFIGKALIEKLLRSCPKLGKIYVLIRGKKGKSAEERLRDILKSSLFNRLRQEQPQTFRKVVAIDGDCSQLGLGISEEDLSKLSNVNIIYHSAASVRFDDPLRDAVLLNTRGTRELVKLAETLAHLKVFVHVSTTYCNPDKHEVEEKVYPPYADWRTTIKLAETYDADTLNVLNLKYGGFQPNTYTFTKSLSEQIINEYRHKLPVVIFRPSIVVASINEPVPGWVDNFNGPTGMLVACGIGIMRTNYANPHSVSDFVPVDVVIRALLVCTYCQGTMADAKFVYNCASGSLVKPLSTKLVVDMGKAMIRYNPFEQTLWSPGGSITTCRVWNFIRVIFLQVFMAILVDCLLRVGKQKPFLLKLQRRIFAANAALHYFLVTSWNFKNDNLLSLDSIVHDHEIEKFAFARNLDIDIANFVRNGIRGAKEFLLHEPPDASPMAKLRFHILETLHFSIQFACALLLLRQAVRAVYFNYL